MKLCCPIGDRDGDGRSHDCDRDYGRGRARGFGHDHDPSHGYGCGLSVVCCPHDRVASLALIINESLRKFKYTFLK